jgi:hypothetical protein
VIGVPVVDEGARLAHQRVDHVAKVDVLFADARLPRQLFEPFVAVPEFKMVLVNAHFQFQADVLATDGVGVALHANHAVRRHRHGNRSAGTATLRWQRAEPVDVFGEALFSRGVTALDQLTHERQIFIDADEVSAATKSQCLVDCILEVTMRRLHVAVLVRLADVDAMATHSVVFQQVVILRGELLVAREVVDRGGQTVAAHATRNSAGQMQGVLQTCREGLERFGMAEMNVLPVGVGQDRMKHQVLE